MTFQYDNYISREPLTTRNVLWSRASVSVCVTVHSRMPTLLHGPGCNLGVVGDAPYLCTIGRICNRCTGCVAMATLWKCVAEPSGNPPGPPHACHTRALRMPAKTPLAGDRMDAPAACAVPFRPYSGGVVTLTRNVSECMLVLAVCLVGCIGKLS